MESKIAVAVSVVDIVVVVDIIVVVAAVLLH